MIFWAFLLQFVPFLLLFYIGVEVFVRDPHHHLHQVTMLFFFSFSGIFLGQFLTNIVPLESAAIPSRYIMLTSSFAIMASGLYFFQLLNRQDKNRFTFHALYLVPLIGLIAVLWKGPLFRLDIVQDIYWRRESYNPFLLTVIIVFAAYTVTAFLIILIRAKRRASEEGLSEHERARLSIVLKGVVFYWIIPMDLLATLDLRVLRIFPFTTLACYAMLLFAFHIRYAMINYGFLSSAAKRYQILFEQSPTGIVLLDSGNRIMEANSTLLHILGIDDLDPAIWKNRPITNFASLDRRDSRQISELQGGWLSKKSVHVTLQIRNYKNESCTMETNTDYIEVEGRFWTYLMMKDITIQKEHEQQLSRLAYYDPLTGLVNRRRFYEELEQICRNSDSDHLSLAVLLIDLDQFKSVNDTLGHQEGDSLLQRFAGQLLAVSPPNACVARLGGDEFAILLPDLSDESSAAEVAHRIVKQDYTPTQMEGHRYRVTASVGICHTARISAPYIADSLLRHADIALYEAKRLGKNQFCIFQEPL